MSISSSPSSTQPYAALGSTSSMSLPVNTNNHQGFESTHAPNAPSFKDGAATSLFAKQSSAFPEPVLVRNLKPTSPMLLFAVKGFSKGAPPSVQMTDGPELPQNKLTTYQYTLGLPVIGVEVDTQVNLSTAQIRLRVGFISTAQRPVDALFVLPGSATVTACSVRVGSNKAVETVVMAKSIAEKLSRRKSGRALNPLPDMGPISDYLPDLFRLPVSKIEPGQEVWFTVELFQTLRYKQGAYHFSLPLQFPRDMLANKVAQAQACRLNIILNSYAANPIVKSDNFHLWLLSTQNNNMRLNIAAAAKPAADGEWQSFEFSYHVPSSSIQTYLCVDNVNELNPKDKTGSFVLHIAPPNERVPAPSGQSEQKGGAESPAMHVNLGAFPRDMVFLLDRSLSMMGEPYTQACNALEVGLKLLSPSDRVTVACFDHEQAWYKDELKLQAVNPENIASIMQWVRSKGPRGNTNIFDPMDRALQMLEKEARVGALPTIVVITDGDTGRERQIVNVAQNRPARVFTFGIGTFCNWYFLKMLAETGRGQNLNAGTPDAIFSEMVALMETSLAPLLTDVKIEVENATETYPSAIPDLCLGRPILVGGNIPHGKKLPESITVTGKLPNGAEYRVVVPAQRVPELPVARIALKQKIDSLTAKTWLTESIDLERRVTTISVVLCFPCPYTRLVAYQTSALQANKGPRVGFASLSAANLYRAGTVASFQVVGLIVVGASLIGFGVAVATGANLLVSTLRTGAIGGVSVNPPDCTDGCTHCCAACSNCFSCIGCGFCCELGVGALSGCGECFGSLGHCVASSAEGCRFCVGDTCGTCFLCLFDSCCGVCSGSCGNICVGCLHAVNGQSCAGGGGGCQCQCQC